MDEYNSHRRYGPPSSCRSPAPSSFQAPFPTYAGLDPCSPSSLLPPFSTPSKPESAGWPFRHFQPPLPQWKGNSLHLPRRLDHTTPNGWTPQDVVVKQEMPEDAWFESSSSPCTPAPSTGPPTPAPPPLLHWKQQLMRSTHQSWNAEQDFSSATSYPREVCSPHTAVEGRPSVLPSSQFSDALGRKSAATVTSGAWEALQAASEAAGPPTPSPAVPSPAQTRRPPRTSCWGDCYRSQDGADSAGLSYSGGSSSADAGNDGNSSSDQEYDDEVVVSSEDLASFPAADLALATVPGTKFDPRSCRFSQNELRPQPIIKKRSKVHVPDDAKDDEYWSMRRKNNAAARRSREARRLRENQISLRAAFLERENQALRDRLRDLRRKSTADATDIVRMATRLKVLGEQQPELLREHSST